MTRSSQGLKPGAVWGGWERRTSRIIAEHFLLVSLPVSTGSTYGGDGGRFGSVRRWSVYWWSVEQSAGCTAALR